MSQWREHQKIDPLLMPFVYATNDSEAETALNQILAASAEPLIKKIVQSKLHVSLNAVRHDDSQFDAQDLCGDIMLQVMNRLREIRTDPDKKIINHFAAYIAMIAHSVCNEYFRQKFPQRTRLRNRIRYLLTHHEDFFLQKTGKRKWIASLSVWKNKTTINQNFSAAEIGQSSELSEVVRSILQQSGAPIAFGELVKMGARVLQIQETPQEAKEAFENESILQRLDQRDDLERLWSEICQLSVRQRTALLLSLKDANGNGVLTMLPVTGIASMRGIAEVLQMPIEDFVQIWNELPLEDNVIAKYLGATRQQVINLRKSARERLVRKVFGKKQYE